MADYSRKQARMVLIVLSGVILLGFIGLIVFLINSISSNSDTQATTETTVALISSTGIDQSLPAEEKIVQFHDALVSNGTDLESLSFNDFQKLRSEQNIELTEYVDELEPLKVKNEIQGFTFDSQDGFYWYPISSAGPEIYTSDRSIGFEQSEEGAALAAIHIYYRTMPFNYSYQQTIEEQTTGSGKADYLLSRELLEEDLLELIGYSYIEAPLGWTIKSYTDTEAEIELFYGYPKLSNVVNVVWRDGDWKLLIPEEKWKRDFTNVLPKTVSFEGVFR